MKNQIKYSKLIAIMLFMLSINLIIKAQSQASLPDKNKTNNLSAWESVPVELVAFTGETYYSNSAIISWTSSLEQNNSFYILERSTDSKNFESIAKIKGAGSSNELESYVYIDKNPSKGNNYYRLKLTDFEGNTQDLNIIKVKVSNTNQQNNSILTTHNPND